jgi:hypothetical protein
MVAVLNSQKVTCIYMYMCTFTTSRLYTIYTMAKNNVFFFSCSFGHFLSTYMYMGIWHFGGKGKGKTKTKGRGERKGMRRKKEERRRRGA